MKIEILYKKSCNLYGDTYNNIYLKKCFSNATIYETSLNDTPKFVTEDIDLLYIGSSSEIHQKIIIEKLLPYKEKIKEMIENNKIVIATGNAFEIFGKEIQDKDEKISCLGIFDYYAKRNMEKRHNSLFLGEFNGYKILGHKSQFSFIYGVKNNFIKMIRGMGNNNEDNNEGYNYKNFYGTYLIGPFLIFNPYFMKHIKSILNDESPLPFEDETIDAYNFRLKEFEDQKTSMISKH